MSGSAESAAVRRRTTMALAVVLAVGLASRRVEGLPQVLVDHAGDVSWAAAVVLGLGVLWPARHPLVAAVGGFAIAVVVEVSQLWHPMWLDDLRANDAVALVLGRGFVWGDLGRYAVGCGFGAIILRRCGSSTRDVSAS